MTAVRLVSTRGAHPFSVLRVLRTMHGTRWVAVPLEPSALEMFRRNLHAALPWGRA